MDFEKIRSLYFERKYSNTKQKCLLCPSKSKTLSKIQIGDNSFINPMSDCKLMGISESGDPVFQCPRDGKINPSQEYLKLVEQRMKEKFFLVEVNIPINCLQQKSQKYEI